MWTQIPRELKLRDIIDVFSHGVTARLVGDLVNIGKIVLQDLLKTLYSLNHFQEEGKSLHRLGQANFF